MDRNYQKQLLQMPAGMGQTEERSFWDKIADQFRAKAAPVPGNGPKVDPDKAKAFVKGFQGG
jgi:hypothetical protein